MNYKIPVLLFFLIVLAYTLIKAKLNPEKKARFYLYKVSDKCEDIGIYYLNHSETENRRYTAQLSESVDTYMIKLRDCEKLLPNEDTLKAPLQEFVNQWNREKIEDSLWQRDGKFLSDLGYLKSLAPDTRKKWKTLFPFFKP